MTFITLTQAFSYLKGKQRDRLVFLVDELVKTLEKRKVSRMFINGIESEFYMSSFWIPDSSGQLSLDQTQKIDLACDTAVDETFNFIKQRKQVDIDLQVCTDFFCGRDQCFL
jgi:hypothetical protein